MTTVAPEKHRPGPSLLVFFGFLCLYLATRSQYYTGDTLNYAHQVDVWVEQGRRIYEFFHPAHVLVVPVAGLFRRLLAPLAGLDTLGSMGVMAALFGAGVVALFHATARLLGLTGRRALLLAGILGLSFGIWDYGTVGEDRIQGLLGCGAFLLVFLRAHDRHLRGRPVSTATGLCLGLILGLAVCAHLSNGILVPFFVLSTPVLFGMASLKRPFFLQALLVAGLVIVAGYLLVAFGNQEQAQSLQDFLHLIFRYHSADQPYFAHDLGLRQLVHQAEMAGIGLVTAFFYVPEVYARMAPVFTPEPIRAILAGLFLLLVATFLGIVACTRPSRRDGCLWTLLLLWGLHSLFFEPISRADWFPILLIGFLLLSSALARLEPVERHGLRGGVWKWAGVFLPVFLLSLVVNNGPHMLDYHREKSLYVRFIEHCTERLPEGSLLVLGNSMALTYFDYFQDRYVYPFSVVTFYDVMGIETPLFVRMKPPPHEVREIRSALAKGRPVFISRRTLEVPPALRGFLELEYSEEAVEAFRRAYRTEPFDHHPYSDLYRVLPRSEGEDAEATKGPP